MGRQAFGNLCIGDRIIVRIDRKICRLMIPMIRFIREFAKENGFSRVELNMWEFNRGALAFYEAAGFKTYRRYMEVRI